MLKNFLHKTKKVKGEFEKFSVKFKNGIDL